MDRARLAEFLRTRREALQPEDVGVPRGRRRRTSGLRREEVAVLSQISTDYYTRIEQPHGPLPSEQVLGAIGRGLHLTLEEQDRMFRLAGYTLGRPEIRGDHVNAGLVRVFDQLQDTPAQIVNTVGETLLQTPLAAALLGDETSYSGLMRSRVYRWFSDPASRRTSHSDDHAAHSRTLVAQIAQAEAAAGPRSRANAIVKALRASSPEFSSLWEQHPVAGPYCEPKRLMHEELGELVLHGQTLLDPDQSQTLMVFTAEAGSETSAKLQLLRVIGQQRMSEEPVLAT